MRWLLSLALFALPLLNACGGGQPGTGIVMDEVRNRSIQYQISAPEGEGPFPLVIISHGTGGHYTDHSWLVRSLVARGYLVAALNHPGDSRGDSSPEGLLRIWDRPGDVSALLDQLLTGPQWSGRIDAGRIAVAGFSSGGNTVISLAGGTFDPSGMERYCTGPNPGPDCSLAQAVPVDMSGAGQDRRDDRVRAVFSMAPAVGPGVPEESLRSITTPVYIVAAEDDELLPPRAHARYYASHIPGAQLKLFPRGGHFLFMDCTMITTVVDYFIEQFNLCGRGIDVDREAVQAEVADLAWVFFEENLRASPEG